LGVEQPLVEPSKLAYVDPKQVERNPQNPRLIFPPTSMAILKDSIKKVGILVPLLIYQKKSDEKYVILDGERRWQCALDLGLDKIPANIIEEPDQIRNILTMFNIHNVREPWRLMPTALKLEVIMRILQEKSDFKLHELTQLSYPTIRRCKILLSYDKKYQDMMLAMGPGEEELVKPDFFIELYPVLIQVFRRFPELKRKYKREDIIDKLLMKYRRGKERKAGEPEIGITDVTDFRQLVLLMKAIDKGVPRDTILQKVINIIEAPEYTIRNAYESSARIVYQLDSIENIVVALLHSLESIEQQTLKNRPELMNSLKQLKALIEKLI